MAGWLDIDDSELRELEVDLSEAPLRVQVGQTKVIRQGLRYLVAAMKEDATGHRYLRQLPAAVSAEMLTRDMGEAGLGPNSGQGSIAHIIVYGSVNNAPVYDHMAGPRRMIPLILRDFADMGEQSVLGQGGGGRDRR